MERKCFMRLRLLRHPTCHDAAYLVGVARRADPERIHEARRAAVRNGLTDYGMSVEDAERWCDAWEIEAASRDLPRDGAYWRTGAEWIAGERAARRPGWS
jgi:hypothetical protein